MAVEMSDLVHRAENWAIRDRGFNRVPEVSTRELRTHHLANQILTRAALMLMQQMGIASIEEFVKVEKEKEAILVGIKTGDKEEEEGEGLGSPVSSPMAMEEFRRRMQNARGSPCTPKTKAALMAEFFPVAKLDLDEKEEPKTKFIIPKNPRKSFKSSEPMFTSTPISKTPRRSSGVVADGGQKKMTPIRYKVRQDSLDGDMTPFENRASRLRRQKLEENRNSFNTSLNSSSSKWK